MNVIIGRIYQAAWGRYVGHREGVLRSLDTPTAFCIDPDPSTHVDTGEDYVIGHVRGDTARDARGDEGGARREADHAPERRTERAVGAPLAVQDAGRTDPADQPLGGGPAGGDANHRPRLTLGGHRPAAYAIITGTEPWWRPCLSRAPDGGIPHVYFLEAASWPSLYCPACFATKGDVLEAAARVRDLLAAGKKDEATAMFAEHSFARQVLRISIRKVAAAPPALAAHLDALGAAGKHQEAAEIRDGVRAPKASAYDADFDSPQTGRLGPSPGSSTSVADVTAGETAPSGLPALERDDPKAEAGSFAPPELWRPTYRNRADYDEWLTERAAICEYLGGMRRELADRAALKLAGAAP